MPQKINNLRTVLTLLLYGDLTKKKGQTLRNTVSMIHIRYLRIIFSLHKIQNIYQLAETGLRKSNWANILYTL